MLVILGISLELVLQHAQSVLLERLVMQDQHLVLLVQLVRAVVLVLHLVVIVMLGVTLQLVLRIAPLVLLELLQVKQVLEAAPTVQLDIKVMKVRVGV